MLTSTQRRTTMRIILILLVKEEAVVLVAANHRGDVLGTKRPAAQNSFSALMWRENTSVAIQIDVAVLDKRSSRALHLDADGGALSAMPSNLCRTSYSTALVG